MSGKKDSHKQVTISTSKMQRIPSSSIVKPEAGGLSPVLGEAVSPK